jgi:ParB family chromosome partitioning protein
MGLLNKEVKVGGLKSQVESNKSVKQVSTLPDNKKSSGRSIPKTVIKTKGRIMSEELIKRLEDFVESISSPKQNFEDNYIVDKLDKAISNKNYEKVMLHLESIKTAEAKAILAELKRAEDPAVKTASASQNKHALQIAEEIAAKVPAHQKIKEPAPTKPVVPTAIPTRSKICTPETALLTEDRDITKQAVEMMDITKIKTKPVFSELFDRNPVIEKAIERSMRKDGAKSYKPLILWNDILVDGHTRLGAAKAAGIKQLPVVRLEFKDGDEAIEYAIAVQVGRRNLTTPERIKLVMHFHKQETELAKKRQGTLASSDANHGKAAEIVAEKLMLSSSMVERIVRLVKSGDKYLLEQVNKGKLTLYGVCKKLSGKNKEGQKVDVTPATDAPKDNTSEAPTVKKPEDKAPHEEPLVAVAKSKLAAQAESGAKKADAPVEENAETQSDTIKNESTPEDTEGTTACSPAELIALIKAIPETEEIAVPANFYQKLRGFQKEAVDSIENLKKNVDKVTPKTQSTSISEDFMFAK